MRNRKFVKYSVSAAALVAFLVFAVWMGRDQPVYQSAPIPAEKPRKVEPVRIETDQYGIRDAAFEVTERRIRRNETFAEILTEHNVPYARVVAVADSARPLFDVRSMRAGRPIRVYRDSLATARYLIYKSDPIHYVVFDLSSDSTLVYEGRREVQVERKRLSGDIHSSLYATLEDQRLAGRLVPQLATSLSEVFAWQVDFFRIQKGDAFSVIYEERSIDGEPIGIGNVVAARFDHRGDSYFGFFFDEGDRPDFYDEEGNSLRKALLKAPLKYKRISSRYTKRRFHPVQKRYKAHLGTDYAANPGTPIHSVGDGVVLDAQYKRYNGNYVKIRHNATYTTGYLHMSRIAKGIRPGSKVKQGQVIGYVGSTGLATGPHLCYRYWKNGVQIDPFKDEIPPAHPVDPELEQEFFQVRDALMPIVRKSSPRQLAGRRRSSSDPVM